MAKLDNLTSETFSELYERQKKSLEDIARIYGVSRVAIYKRFKKAGLERRSRFLARIEAQKQGKVPQQYYRINDEFFSRWSAEMAYVLGLIITDGCISKHGVVTLSVNDREVMEKVKTLMRSEHPITPSRHQRGLFHFNFAREGLVNDLAKLGIGPRKSLTVKFPPVPEAYMADFIRGVFDGDGSVFFRKNNDTYPLMTSFCSGSKDFIVELEYNLRKLGLPKRTIYQEKTKNGFFYNIKYSHKNSQKLFDILYRNYPNIPFLERKYNKFVEGFKISKGRHERV